MHGKRSVSWYYRVSRSHHKRNWYAAKEIDAKYVLDGSATVQRAIRAEATNDDSILLKVAQPFLGARLHVGGKLNQDRKTIVDLLNVTAKIIFPDKECMDASVEVHSVRNM